MADVHNRFMVYLAGPITGTSYEGCTDWRTYVCDRLPDQIAGFSPLRTKTYLETETYVQACYEGGEWPLSTQRGIYARDRYDCTRADVVLVNLLGAKIVSIGTVMEIAWAADHNIPVVLVMEKADNIHDHPMIREACPFRVETLDEAVHVIRAILLP